MTTDHIRLERQGFIAHIVLNRPEKLNALTFEMYARIGALLAELEADARTRVVVLRGEGRAFSTGFDLGAREEELSLEQRRERLFRVANANRWKIWGLTKPVIAKLQGYCMAGALEMVLPCDFILAAEDCQLGEPEVLFGAGPAFLIVPWLVGVHRAKDILLTGQRFTGREAADWGLITRAVPAAQLDQAVAEQAEHLAKLPPPAVMLVKAGINRAYEVRGMQTSIDTWVETSLNLPQMETDEVREFRRRVREQGVKAALQWRDAFYAGTQPTGGPAR